MLHKGKLHNALHTKRSQFALYDGSFTEQRKAYQHALETLCIDYPSSVALDALLPPEGTQVAGARPTIEYDRWLATLGMSNYTGPVFPFGRDFTTHEQAREWAECIEGITTIAVDGSQLLPWRDASIPVALIQVGFFANPHLKGHPYTKDVRMDVLSPEEIMEESKIEKSEPDSYPYSDMMVTLRRHLLEVETLCQQMEHYAHIRQSIRANGHSQNGFAGFGGPPAHSPVVFFDGSLVASFATHMPNPYRDQYVGAALSLLHTSERLRIPLIGYIDTSYARDVITMLRRLDDMKSQPVLRDTKKIHDSLLWSGHLAWGDRTPAFVCARGDILQSYGEDANRVCFCYLQTTAKNAPARLEFPRWLLDEGLLDPVLDVIRSEVIAGNGYPYAIETADAASVITIQDRDEFYTHFKAFIEKQGGKFTFSPKSQSKGRRR